MAAILDEHKQWVDTGGRPLNNGRLYIGTAGADPVANPQTVYSDRELTTVAANPQTLDSTGRTTVKLYIGGEYSIQVNDKNGVQAYQNLEAGEKSADVSTTALENVVGGNTITATGLPTVLAYTDKAQFIFTAAQVNTGAVTLNIDGLGAKSVLKNHDEALVGGEIEANQIVIVVYNSTDDVFEITNQNVAPQIQAAKDFSDVNYTASSGSYTTTGNDKHHFIDFTSGGTLGLLAAATLGDGYVLYARNSTAGRIPIDPSGSELVNGVEVDTIPPGASLMLVCDGTAFYTILLSTTIGGRITGFGTSNSGGDPDHDIAIAAGECDDDSSTPVLMARGGAFVKRIDAVWVEGNNQGGLDTGTVAADSWYHIFIIQSTTSGTVDGLFSLSVSSPTLPTGYTRKRRIGSVLTDGSANIIGFSQDGDDWLWDDPVVDFDVTNPGTAAVSRTMSVPSGLKVIWHGAGSYDVNNPATDDATLFSSLDVNDTVPTIKNSQLGVAGGGNAQTATSEMRVKTNTSSQIRVRSSVSGVSTAVSGVTYGWRDTRGRVD